MQVFRGLDDASACRNGFVSIGNFDGVHRGHQSMIGALIRNARARGVPAVIFTFDPHPIALLRPHQSPPPLSTTERKLELFSQHGIDFVEVYPTDQALLNLSPRAFFDQIIVGRLRAGGLVEGPNFFFGHDRRGNIETLRGFCEATGIELEIVPPVTVEEALVSSTEIRRLIADGRVREAADFLGYHYPVSGTVVCGAERGRTIGFPTANLEGIRTVLPRDGVYAGRARVGAQWHAAGINLGPSPTFADQERKVEVHLVDFSGDLYGSRVVVEFFDRLRDTVRFSGIDELKAQLADDIERARALAKAISSR
ncbi:MAG TPA: bifunctional riboflavin kinase/FAD synthetase [Planctomycetaceae bacterium]|nr:bifunctional riboflavin kinase/FAD synthetase [Planctomycetaceae bacterium]